MRTFLQTYLIGLTAMCLASGCATPKKQLTVKPTGTALQIYEDNLNDGLVMLEKFDGQQSYIIRYHVRATKFDTVEELTSEYRLRALDYLVRYMNEGSAGHKLDPQIMLQRLKTKRKQEPDGDLLLEFSVPVARVKLVYEK